MPGWRRRSPFETINKVCASGMIAVVHAAHLIDEEEVSVAVAGGMESMSNAPYAALNARFGYRFGDGALVDLMVYDGLLDPWSRNTMAQAQSKVNADLKITREVQDEFAYNSHARAARATADGAFRDEIMPLKVATKAKGKLVVDKLPVQARPRIPVHAGGGNGAGSRVWGHESAESLVPDPKRFSPYVTGDVPFTLVDKDEPIRADASLESMAKLQPLDKDGTVTAGNAPGVNDGAAALVLSNEAYAQQSGREVLGDDRRARRRVWDPPYLALTPAMAAQKLLDRQGLKTERHRRVGSQRSVRGRRLEHGEPPGPRSADAQHVRRRSRFRSSGRRIGRTHHGIRRPSVAPPRRRLRHRRDLQRRRPGRRDFGPSFMTARSSRTMVEEAPAFRWSHGRRRRLNAHPCAGDRLRVRLAQSKSGAVRSLAGCKTTGVSEAIVREILAASELLTT